MYADDLYTALGRYSFRFLRLTTSKDFKPSKKHVTTLAEHCQHLQAVTFRKANGNTVNTVVKEKEETWGVLRHVCTSSSRSQCEPVVFRLLGTGIV